MSVVLDTNIALYFLGGRLDEPLPSGPYAISIITELELLSFPGISESEERDIRAFAQAVDCVPLNDDVKEHAIRIRRTHGLRLPDAIIAATAIVHQATLLTNDSKIVTRGVVTTMSLRLRST